MSTAEEASAPTALDLLFGQDTDAAEILVGEIVSVGDQSFAPALAHLPEATRNAAAQEAAAAAAALLKVDLVGVLVRGWREHPAIVSAGRRTLASPGSTELVSMTGHEITSDQQPSISIMIDGHRVATLQLGLTIVFIIRDLLLGISGGRLTAVHSGRCDITVALAVPGTDPLVRRARLELPGIVSSPQQVRILPVSEYPADAPQAETADDESAQHRVREPEDTHERVRALKDAGGEAAEVLRPRLRDLRLPSWRLPRLGRRLARHRPASALDVRAVPAYPRPDILSVRDTGSPATDTVRVEPSPGAGVTRVTADEETPAGDGPGGGADGSEGGPGRDSGGGHSGNCADDDGWVPPARPRYLVGQCPESVAVDKPFSLLASINMGASLTSAELELFDVPSEGQDVVLVMYAPGLHVLSDHQQTVHVPADGNSRPVRFELRADTPGPAKVSITAWIGGTHLGELRVEITAERDRAPGPHREVRAEITTQPTAGAVSLVVRYDPSQQAYRFEFRDEDNPNEVPSNLAYDPGPVVEQLIADLDNLAAGRSGYSADQTRDYLVNAGARLWQQLIPEQLREQFWDRQHRIRQLTILADKDAVPWELLYPMDPGHDAGFLVEQFPVTRAIFGWRPGRTLRLQPARFVLPEGSLHEAAAEVEAMRRLLDPGQAPGAVISELTPLTDLIGSGQFGLLHFACHNTYEPVGGSSIRLGRVRFTPTLLEVAAIQKALQGSAPTVFINACRSAGLAATYNRLDGWASKFLEAGAAAFIGSLWAVSDGASREFAEELYRCLKNGLTLGDAVMQARRAAANMPDDPTWLAYTVYGDPGATIRRSP
jgi:CHAT domain